MAELAVQTLSLLEEKLDDLEFLVHGLVLESATTAVPHQDALKNRLDRLEVELKTTIQQSPVAMDLLALSEYPSASSIVFEALIAAQRHRCLSSSRHHCSSLQVKMIRYVQRSSPSSPLPLRHIRARYLNCTCSNRYLSQKPRPFCRCACLRIDSHAQRRCMRCKPR